MNDPLVSVLERTNEADDLDFKGSFDPSVAGSWLELIKDIVAFANSGGGTILIGANDDGTPSGKDVSALLSVDPADITNKVHKYTGHHFSTFDIVETQKAGATICAIRVGGVHVPMVFTSVGTYDAGGGKQRAAFALGTVYFRHGAKSEPGTSDDLHAFLERELERIRRSWLDGIAKVVEAPTGSRFAVLPPESTPTGPSGALPIQLTDDVAAPAYYAIPIDSTHPFRQKEVIREVNIKLAGERTVNSRDIVCIRRVYKIHLEINFCYTQNFVSPRYSQQFVDWIVGKYSEDELFFEKTRTAFDALHPASAAGA
jgi:Putative DNA-binding domain/EC042_2821-lke REase